MATLVNSLRTGALSSNTDLSQWIQGIKVPVTKRYHNDMKDNTKMVPFKSWWSILRPLFLLSLRIKS